MVQDIIVWQAVRELAPDLAARAPEGDALRTMPPDLVERAKRAGLFRLNLPRSLGGLEIDPTTTVELLEEISRADGSAGWTVLIGNSTAFFAWLDPIVARRLIAGQVDFVSTSMWAPNGRAVPDGEGGFTVSGRWPFNSGAPHADWLQVGVLVMDGDAPGRRPDGAPDWRFAFLARAAANIEDDWDAAGLRGTGSHHVAIADQKVPAECVVAPFFEPARHEGPLWRIPLVTLATIHMAAFPLGVARRALDEFAVTAASKVRGPANQPLAHDGHVQVELARAEAGLQAARSLVFDAIADVWATACRGDQPSLTQRARMLLATNQATRAGVEATDRVFRLAGADAVRPDQALQRCWRDLHVGAQHILFSASRDQAFARQLLGLDQPTFLI